MGSHLVGSRCEAQDAEEDETHEGVEALHDLDGVRAKPTNQERGWHL